MQFAMMIVICAVNCTGAQTTVQAQQGAKPEGAPQTESPSSRPQEPAPPRPQRGRGDQFRVPDEVQLVRDVVYSRAETDAGEPVELMLDAAFLKQSDGKPMPAIIYIHGGGWHSGSRQSGLQQAVAFAMGGYFAVTIDYRLSDRAKFPAAVDDCKNAVRFIRDNAEELGVDPQRIGVWGHSAGGHLAALLATSGNDEVAFDHGDSDVSAAVTCAVNVSGPTDLTRDGADGPIARWLGAPPNVKPELAKRASPLTYVDAGDPPVLIVHGTADAIVNIRHAELFDTALTDAGVEVELLRVEGAGHGINQPRVYVRIAEFFDENLGGKAVDTVRNLRRAAGNVQPESQ